MAVYSIVFLAITLSTSTAAKPVPDNLGLSLLTTLRCSVISPRLDVVDEDDRGHKKVVHPEIVNVDIIIYEVHGKAAGDSEGGEAGIATGTGVGVGQAVGAGVSADIGVGQGFLSTL